MNKKCPFCGEEPKMKRVGTGAVVLHCCRWSSEAFLSVPKAFEWFNKRARIGGRKKAVEAKV